MLLLNWPRSSRSSWISSSKISYWLEKTKTLVFDIRGRCTRSRISATCSMILSYKKRKMSQKTFVHYNSQTYCLSLARLAGALGPSSSSIHNKILTSATERAKQRLQILVHNRPRSFSTHAVSIVGHGRWRRRSRNAWYFVSIFGSAMSTDTSKLVEISFIKLASHTN